MKIFATVCLSLWAWSASAAHDILAGPFTNAANGHFYYLLNSTTWSNSEARAIFYGGHLATVRDADENEWIVDTFAHYGGVIRPLWIGLTDRRVEGNFEWVSGEPLNYTKWNTLSGEPNNSGGSGYEEDFVYIVQENSGNPTVLATFWNDVPNDGYGVIPPIFGVMETTQPIDPPPPVVPPPQVQLHFSCVEVCWQSMTNAQYQVQWRSAENIPNPFPTTNLWNNLGSPVSGTGAEICVTDTPHGTNRLYRVAVLP